MRLGRRRVRDRDESAQGRRVRRPWPLRHRLYGNAAVILRYDRPTRALAACLAGVAGFVDALAFLELGGFFVSFMSGNSTRLGVGLAGNITHVGVAGGLIAAFVAGVVLGSLVGRAARARRARMILALIAVLLGLAAGFTFERDGEVSIGLTYMTGALVKCGQHLAAALTGGAPWGWTPYLLLWGGLVVGATVGGVAYHALGLQSLWIAAGAAGVLALVARRLSPPGGL